MAGIYERITSTGEAPEPKIPVHAFGAALREWARGNITKADLVGAFSLDATAQNELDAIATKYGGLTGDFARASFVVLLEDALILAEAGLYSKAKVQMVLGF